jgi:protein tyrosine phosphatase
MQPANGTAPALFSGTMQELIERHYMAVEDCLARNDLRGAEKLYATIYNLSESERPRALFGRACLAMRQLRYIRVLELCKAILTIENFHLQTLRLVDEVERVIPGIYRPKVATFEDSIPHFQCKGLTEGFETAYGMTEITSFKREHPLVEGSHIDNRYNNIFPTQKTLVQVHICPNDPYVNANYVHYQELCFIAAQFPKIHAFHKFWGMIFENRVRIIVNLTNNSEVIQTGMPLESCLYWPQTLNEPSHYGHFRVILTSVASKPFYKVLTFELFDERTSETRAVTKFQCSEWPDHGVPKDVNVLLSLLADVRALQQEVGIQFPILAHCKAGVGRSGVAILLHIALHLLSKGATRINFCELLIALRKCRAGLVQNAEQYNYVLYCFEKACQRSKSQ